MNGLAVRSFADLSESSDLNFTITHHFARLVRLCDMLRAGQRAAKPGKRFLRSLATQTSLPQKDCTSITPPYPRLLKTLKEVRNVLPRGTKLTLAEKILYAHLRNPEESLGGEGKIRGERYLKLRPDRVAMQVSCETQLYTQSPAQLYCRMLRHRWLCSSS